MVWFVKPGASHDRKGVPGAKPVGDLRSALLGARRSCGQCRNSRRPETRNDDAPATHILTSGALGCGGITLTRHSQCAYCGGLGRNSIAPAASCSVGAIPLHAEAVSAFRFIQPCSPVSAKSVPAGDDWLHEPKLDGYRLQVAKHGRVMRLYSRRGHDWSRRLVGLADALRA